MNKDQIINSLQKIIPKKDIISNNEELSKYNKDWRGFYNYKSICIVFPNSKIEISKILNYVLVIILKLFHRLEIQV